jgi:hypothetical protein
MNCKSCATLLPDNSKFCPQCGGKVVINRLSLKGTWSEFIGPFLNWDNFFWQTFRDLFVRPEQVLLAYTAGARKRYFQPFSFMIIYGTFTVLFYKVFPMDFEEIKASSAQNPEFDPSSFTEAYIANYNIFLLLTIPVFALMGWLIFRKFKDNFAEHLVYNAYIQAQVGYIALFTQLVLYNLLKVNSGIFFTVSTLASFLYGAFVFHRLYQLSLGKTIVYTLKFIGLLLVLLVFATIVGTFIALTLKG